MEFVNSSDFALQQDRDDELRSYREKFYIPTTSSGGEVIYFCGHSLGLQPKSTRDFVQAELEDWATRAVKGHFEGENPWFSYHKGLRPSLARLAGAQEDEVVPMASLTANLHFLLASFYRPQAGKFKILMESGAFPSDEYALESQLNFHGFDPEVGLIKVGSQNGGGVLSISEIISAIEENANELCLVFLPGVQYYTGQLLEMEEVVKTGHRNGITVGFDLAHAIGNVPLELHEWGADFAVWCTYKYLNSGPGATGGLFVHQNHSNKSDLPRLAGWWGHNEETRFEMKPGFDPIPSAEGWQLSNANVLSMASQRASLEIFDQAGLTNLRKKSLSLTGYLQFLLEDLGRDDLFRIITPSNPERRGCQLSIHCRTSGYQIYQNLQSHNVVIDWREPDVIRLAPIPLYNSFYDVWSFRQILEQTLAELGL